MEFDLRKYLRLVLQWWWLIAIGAIVPATLSYYFVSQRPELYQARVVLMVGTTFQSANPNTSEMGVAMRLAQGYAEMVRYRPVTNGVIQKLGLGTSPEALALQITAAVRPEANLLEIMVTDQNPEAAAAIANALAEELILQTPAGQVQGEQQRFVEAQLEELRNKIQQVQQEIGQQSSQLADLTSAAEIQEAQQSIQSLEAVLSRYRTEYAALLRSYSADTINQLTIVEPAIVPVRPIGGRVGLVVAIAAAAGIGLALGGVFLIEYLDDSLKWSQQEGGDLLGLPVLGALGRMPTRKEQILAQPRALNHGAERLRALRTTLLLDRMERTYQTMLITSPVSGEGKSFTCVHLGVILSDAGGGDPV